MKEWFLLGVLFLFFASFASAQLGNIEGQIEDASENLENNVTAIREFTERDKWEFIGSQWKEFLLKNKVIAGMDAFFTKINVVFVAIFARDWSLSLEMLFALTLWIIFFICLLFYFPPTGRWALLTLGITIVLGHMQVYNALSSLAYKAILFKASNSAKLISFVLFVGILAVFITINRLISKKVAILREKQEKEELKRRVKGQEKFQEGISRGTS